MARALREDTEKAKHLGLSPAEEAFCDALANNPSARELMGDELLVTIDWQYKDNVRARLRTMIKALLKSHKYPPDQEARAIELVLLQTEMISEEWSREDQGNQIEAAVARQDPS